MLVVVQERDKNYRDQKVSDEDDSWVQIGVAGQRITEDLTIVEASKVCLRIYT